MRSLHFANGGLHFINMNVQQHVDDPPTLRSEDTELNERFSYWVSAFRVLRKRYPTMDDIIQWARQQGK